MGAGGQGGGAMIVDLSKLPANLEPEFTLWRTGQGGLLSRRRSMKGAPRPIHKKQGTKVHQCEQPAQSAG